MNAPLEVAADWLGTFAVHSTIVLGAALALSFTLRDRALAWQEAGLRLSMWVALASTTLQCALRGVWTPELRIAVDAMIATPPPESPDGAAIDAAGPVAIAWWHGMPWQLLVVAGAFGCAVCGLVWLWNVHRRLHAVLGDRRPETDARVLTVAAGVARSLGMRQSPHVSRSASIATPIAFGWLQPEICLPMRVGELSDPSLRAMLAHEVAHLRAADPGRMWAAAWLQALFPWQPLLLPVRRRWARLVELRCDAIAAGLVTPTAVARCLLDVADWLRPHAPAPVVALGMAARPSVLRERVEAALRGRPFRGIRRRATLALGGVSCLALTAAAPTVATDPEPVFELRMPIPADAAVGSAAFLLEALQAEHAELRTEADVLRAELRQQPAAPQLMALLGEIDRRLHALEQKRARLGALLSTTPSDNH
jgi:beta-lactamase regulating signal transducer with metallopeptidase domain